MDDLRVFRQIVLAEHENGCSVKSIAGTFGISRESAREHLGAAQLQRDQQPKPSAVANGFSPAPQPPSCCHEPVCPRAEIMLLLTPESPMEQRVDALARATAMACAGLSDDQLLSCFSHSFELASECRFSARFARVYKTERATLEGNASRGAQCGAPGERQAHRKPFVHRTGQKEVA